MNEVRVNCLIRYLEVLVEASKYGEILHKEIQAVTNELQKELIN